MIPKRCKHCKSKLFEAIPFKTTQQAIVEFAQLSEVPDREAIIASKWIHPGLHCPNGCTKVFIEYRIDLPEMTIREAIAIGHRYSQEHHQEFIETQGVISRILACVHCANFKGAAVEGGHTNNLYRNPKHRPLANHKVVQVSCGVLEVQQLEGAWWYEKGESQPHCDFFKYNRSFINVYKDVTGWNEYPEQ